MGNCLHFTESEPNLVLSQIEPSLDVGIAEIAHYIV